MILAVDAQHVVLNSDWFKGIPVRWIKLMCDCMKCPH